MTNTVGIVVLDEPVLPDDSSLQPIDAAVEARLAEMLEAKNFERVMIDALRLSWLPVRVYPRTLISDADANDSVADDTIFDDLSTRFLMIFLAINLFN